MRYKKAAICVIAASLLVCAAAIQFPLNPEKSNTDNHFNFTENGLHINHTDTADTADKTSSLPSSAHDYIDSYIGGALVFQPLALSYMPADGSIYTGITENDGVLTLSVDGNPPETHQLTDTTVYTREEFLNLLGDSSRQAYNLDTILPPEVTSVTWRSYGEDWAILELALENGETRLWFGGSLRLYALIDAADTFRFFANGALWTYHPHFSTILPIRFDLDSPVSLMTASGGLSDIIDRDTEWTTTLTINPGETVYWQPSPDGLPESGAVLSYTYQINCEEWTENLELRPAMDYEGPFGKTYGVSNNWLGAASSAIHTSALTVDADTKELVVCGYSGGGPYALRNELPDTITVAGKVLPPKVIDVAEVQDK